MLSNVSKIIFGVFLIVTSATMVFSCTVAGIMSLSQETSMYVLMFFCIVPVAASLLVGFWGFNLVVGACYSLQRRYYEDN